MGGTGWQQGGRPSPQRIALCYRAAGVERGGARRPAASLWPGAGASARLCLHAGGWLHIWCLGGSAPPAAGQTCPGHREGRGLQCVGRKVAC